MKWHQSVSRAKIHLLLHQLFLLSSEILLEQLLHRMPQLADAEIRQMVNGPESFTPDSKYILGEAPEVRTFARCDSVCLRINCPLSCDQSQSSFGRRIVLQRHILSKRLGCLNVLSTL